MADHGRGRLSLADVVDPVTGRSPLHVAVASGKKDALRVLLAAGFPPAHQSKDKQSAYALAQQLKAQDLVLVFRQFLVQQVAANDVESVRQLLAAGVDVGVADAATGGSLLHWAASCQAVEVLRDLLSREDVQQQKLVDARNGEGATPLHLACHANHVECTTLLLEHHADASLKGDKGFSKDRTALELATKPEVRDLFSKSVEDEGEKVKKEMEDTSEGDNEEERLCGATTAARSPEWETAAAARRERSAGEPVEENHRSTRARVAGSQHAGRRARDAGLRPQAAGREGGRAEAA